MDRSPFAAVAGLAALLAGVATPLGAAPPPSSAVPRASCAIVVDGHLDEAAWEEALLLELAYELIPGDSTPAPVRTEVLVTHDDDKLYWAFRAYDPDPASIRAHLSDRDKVLADDYVGIVLDTFHDQRRAFELEVNPLGVQTDYFRSEVTGGFAIEDVTWDGLWESAGRITSEGYITEAAIPFSSLSFPRQPGEQRWGFTAYRAWPRSALYVLSLVPTDRDDPCLLCQIVDLTGFADVSPGHNLELTPTATAERVDRRQPLAGGRLEEGDPEVEAGLSLRWGITPNLNLNATVNPDFSQVEADAAQLDVNTRFALFFPEKRPFFLEGADYFATPLRAVNTRAVADPSWGLKLTGKEGRNAVGAFIAEDEVTNLILPGNQVSGFTTLPGDSTTGVLRYRRDLGRSSTLGLLATGRQGEGYSSHLAGVDALVKLSDSKALELQMLESRTEYPEAVATAFGQPRRRFGGTALHARFAHSGSDWAYFAGWQRLDPGFRADLGFIPRVDTETAEAGFKRIVRRQAGGWFTLLEGGLEASRTEFVGGERGGEASDEAVALVATWQGPLQSFASLRVAREREQFDGETYDQEVQSFAFSIQPSGDFGFSLSGDFGDTVDFENSRAAELLRLGPGANLRLGRHLELDLQYLVERLEVEGDRLYQAVLSQARLVYQLNVRTFARGIVQYFDIERRPELYLRPVEAAEETLLTQLLFSYKLNPQTLLFVGYSDDYLGSSTSDLTQADRTLFVKVSYAWVL
jgi:hypothetical protein